MVDSINMGSKNLFSIVIPVFNGEKTVEELCLKIDAVFKNMHRDYEIILVDDGSPDDSWETIKKIKGHHSNVRAFRLARNFGQHNAIMCGFNYARGEYVITIDDDLQHPPEEIEKLIGQIDKGYDVVYGLYSEKKHKAFRNLGSRFVQLIYQRALGVKGEVTSLRIIKYPIVGAICGYNKGFTYIDGLIAWFSDNIGYVKINHSERKCGKSGYSFRKLLVLGMNLLTNFSTFPLQLASWLGLLFSMVGFFMALIYFGANIFIGITISGFTTIVMAVTFFAGIQLLMLGLIGEYVGRINLNINSKPQFFVSEELVD